MLAMSLVAFGAGNLENSYSMVWSETTALDADAYYGVSGPFDLDGDGFDEFIAYTDDGGMTAHLYENTGDNTFEEKWSTVISKSVYSYTISEATGDLNGDGIAELYMGGRMPAGLADSASLFIFQVDTAAADVALTLIAEVDPTALSANFAGGIVKTIVPGDIDGDGVDELILSLDVPDAIMVLSLDPSTDFDFPSWIVEFEDVSVTSSVYEGIVVGDFDNDGFMNFSATEWNSNGTAFYNVDGADQYSLNTYHTDLGGDGPLRGMVGSDLDGDGYIELLIPDDDGIFWILSNEGDLSDVTMNRIYTDTMRYGGSELGNTDVWRGTADGPDFMVTTRAGYVLDFEWDGVNSILDSTSWTRYVAYEDLTKLYPKALTIGDFDDDGLDDIIFVSVDDATAFMLEHDGWNNAAGISTYATMADTSSSPVTPGYQTRGLSAGSDVDQDGRNEVIITDYQVQGVHIYEAAGDNTLEWVATLSNADSYGSTPTGVEIGDLDGNGREEIVFMLDYGHGTDSTSRVIEGIQAWEWDGNVGSDTYVRSVLKLDLASTGVEIDRYRNESHNIEIADVDGDGVQELCFANDGSSGTLNDVFVIASVDGDFDSGIYGLTTEWIADRTTLIGGSPARGGPSIADLDGDGTPEILFNNWDYGAVHIVKSTAADTYEWVESFNADTTASSDMTVYGRTFVSDFNGDGMDDVVGGLYSKGWIWHLEGAATYDSVSYDNGMLTRVSDFGAAWAVTGGDVNNDGIDEVFSVDYGHGRLYQWDYNGGAWDMSVVANWPDEMGGFALAFSDDLDGDGKPEVVQGFLEPAYDGDVPSQLNPNGYTFAVHEFPTVVSNDEKWTIITPDDYKLSQNYPNPFNPNTTIEFTLPLAKDNVNVIIYNMRGQEVVRLANNASYSKGTHSVTWNSLKADGAPAAAGLYIYELRSGNVSKTAKMTLIK
jgi:hypothetical protein